MTSNVNAHGQYEPEHVIWIEMRQNGAQTHSAAPVSQLVQHGPKLGALIKVPAQLA
jgi:hypothetical protein